MSAPAIKAIRGMNDILPEQSSYWQRIESACRHIATTYGYQEIRLPIVEQTALFKRTIGDETDIVAKEMYTFEDRNGDSLSLRPEGTAGCVRAGIEQGLLYNQIQRLWYMGPMFRHERPQKGRYRQFYQFGVEAFGMPGPAIDAELICMTWRLWQALGLADQVSLQLNTLGSKAARTVYRDQLVEYFKAHSDKLDEDSQRRLELNPLRILDNKNPDMQELIANAPSILDHLDEESADHFTGLQKLLDSAGIQYEINPSIVRGLDYYDFTVFEWVTTELGAQGTVCAGGRYNTLVEQLGGQATPAIGFALGLERLVLLLQQLGSTLQAPDLYLVLVGDVAEEVGLALAEKIRDRNPNCKVMLNAAPGGFKAQFKRADKSGAHWAITIGDDEVAKQQVALKDLRGDSGQRELSFDDLLSWVEGEIYESACD